MIVKILKYAIILIMISSSVNAYAEIDEEAFKNDISNIPPSYQKDYEKALADWQELKKVESDFYKVLGHEIHGDNRPFSLLMMDNTLAHFIYPWTLNNQFPFATTHNTPYFTHYHPHSKMDNIGEVKGKLIAVFVNGLSYEDFKSQQNATQVHIKQDVDEITLLLNAEANADWDITWDEGVKINKIIIPRSSANFRIKTQTPIHDLIKSNKSLLGYSDNIYVGKEDSELKWGSYQRYKNRIKESTGIEPYSIWFGEKNKRIDINAKRNQISFPQNSENGLFYKSDKSHNSKIIFRSTDGYSTSTSSRGFKVIDSRISGLWYWEAKLALSESLPIQEKFNFGAGSDNAKFPEKISNILKNGDVLQIALDLNEYNLYVGLNGHWIVGNPMSKGSGVQLEPNIFQYPFIGVWQGSSSGEVLVNFGATPFIYKPPQNYLPFDARYSEARKSDESKTNSIYQVQKADLELAQFPTKIYERTSPQFKIAWQGFQKAIKNYRQSACSLTYAYKANIKVSASSLDPQCVWFIKGYFGNNIEFPITSLQYSQGKAKEKLPNIDIRNAKLHFLRKYGVKGQDNHELKSTSLKITDTSAPLVIFIYAHEPMLWNIDLAKGVKIRQIIMYGQYAQQYTFNKKVNIPVSLYSAEEKSSGVVWPAIQAGEQSAAAMRDQLKMLIGLTPATIQKDRSYETCIIDGILGADYLSQK